MQSRQWFIHQNSRRPAISGKSRHLVQTAKENPVPNDLVASDVDARCAVQVYTLLAATSFMHL
jgi:hypothetical protein